MEMGSGRFDPEDVLDKNTVIRSIFRRECQAALLVARSFSYPVFLIFFMLFSQNHFHLDQFFSISNQSEPLSSFIDKLYSLQPMLWSSPLFLSNNFPGPIFCRSKNWLNIWDIKF